MYSSHDDTGATAVEYAIMVAFIAAVIAGTVATLGQTVLNLFTPITTLF